MNKVEANENGITVTDYRGCKVVDIRGSFGKDTSVRFTSYRRSSKLELGGHIIWNVSDYEWTGAPENEPKAQVSESRIDIKEVMKWMQKKE